MVSAPTSPLRKADDKENQQVQHWKLPLTTKSMAHRRHSLAPPKSILKNSNKAPLLDSDTMNNTIAIMEKLPSKDNTVHSTASNRRVSFAPEVTLHKIDLIPQYFEPSPKRQPRRRDTLQFVPPVRINDKFEDRDESSDMEIDEESLSKSPFVIYQDDDEEEDSEFNSLFDESEDMDVVTHHGNLKVDEIDQLQSEESMDFTDHQGKQFGVNVDLQGVELVENDENMEFTVHQGREIMEDTMDLTVHQGKEIVDENMDLTVHQGKEIIEDMEVENDNMELTQHQGKEIDENMDLTIHQGKQIVEETMDLTVHQGKELSNEENMDLTVHQGQAIPDEETMDLTIHQGSIPNKNMDLPIQSQTIPNESDSSDIEFTSHQDNPQLATRQLSTITEVTEVTEPEREEFVNPLLDRIQSETKSSFDSSEMDESEITQEPTTTAFGDPSIFTDILRVTGASQDEETDKSTPIKRPYSTPRKVTEQGSPSSSLKKRKLSMTPLAKVTIPILEPHSPIPSEAPVEHSFIEDTPSTPSKDSSLLKSPEHPDIEKMIQALTPNRRRESFTYVSRSPRRNSLSEEGVLTPLRDAKDNVSGSLNLQQAVVTTTVPLAGTDEESQIMEDDDYIPVDLKTFLKFTNIRFFDDLNVKDTSIELPLSNQTEPANLNDYILGLQKLKQLELINFSCNELKKNITEGQDLFNTIEQEIQEENPPLIREYFELEAPVQNNMNFQFQELKNYARQQSKKIWYGWRSKLVKGVHQLLLLNKDTLDENKSMINVKIDELTQDETRLQGELSNLQLKLAKLMRHKEQFLECDRETLISLRQQLIGVSNECIEKKTKLESLLQESETLQLKSMELNGKIESLNNEITQLNNQIKDNQLYNKSDVESLKLKFSLLERITGLRLQKIESEKIHILIDNVDIVYDTLNDTSDFKFQITDSIIVNKFQPMILSNITSIGLNKVLEFLDKYENLRTFNEKFNKFKLYSNDVIKSKSNDDNIIVTIKELHENFKKIIKFPIDFQCIINNKISFEELSIDIVGSSEDKDISDLKNLLNRINLL